jgi:hypothetical protein
MLELPGWNPLGSGRASGVIPVRHVLVPGRMLDMVVWQALRRIQCIRDTRSGGDPPCRARYLREGGLLMRACQERFHAWAGRTHIHEGPTGEPLWVGDFYCSGQLPQQVSTVATRSNVCRQRLKFRCNIRILHQKLSNNFLH